MSPLLQSCAKSPSPCAVIAYTAAAALAIGCCLYVALVIGASRVEAPYPVLNRVFLSIKGAV